MTIWQKTIIVTLSLLPKPCNDLVQNPTVDVQGKEKVIEGKAENSTKQHSESETKSGLPNAESYAERMS